jgi:hypothetical protein
MMSLLFWIPVVCSTWEPETEEKSIFLPLQKVKTNRRTSKEIFRGQEVPEVVPKRR